MPRFSILLLGVLISLGLVDARADALDRSVLPIAEPQPPSIDELDVRNATPPPPFEVKAPEGAPNVVIVLIDDMGFGTASSFGGPVEMPTLERLAQQGLRYNNFHTTALCSPTRVALKTGRNHHTANAGSVMEIATAFPGNQGRVPNRVAPLAEMLRLNGYSTAAFGKWHETAPWETSVSGPFDRWPTHQGFDKFYGFLGGETNQWSPLIFDGVTRIEAPVDPDYHFTTDMTDQAVRWVQAQQALTPDKPFFVYYAPGATHAPHHVPKEWADRYRGRFDAGWDALRREIFERQKRLGVIPAETELAAKPEAIRDWDALSEDERRLFRRQAEVFAGFAAHTDHEIGRLVEAIEAIGELDDTLFVYIAGDNGASAEGGMLGTSNENLYFNRLSDTLDHQLAQIERWGDPTTYPHMAAGWAVAFSSPFAWTKQVASNFGGTRNGMVVHWPRGIRARGEIRSQFHHAIDVAPTVLEVARLPEPTSVNGTPQIPMEGVSLAYTFEAPQAESRHRTQYFEIMGNRAIYHDGWFAGTVHRAPWEFDPRRPLAQDVWELYDVRSDFSLARDLAAEQPQKLAELQALFLAEAEKYHVLPLDDRGVERFNPSMAGRPDLMGGRKSLTLRAGAPGLLENAFINLKNVSSRITAEIVVPAGGASGVVVAQGGRFAGWSLYLHEGRPAFTYNFLGLEATTLRGERPLAPGAHTLVYDFAYDGGGPGRGGAATLRVDGAPVAEARIERTVPSTFSGDETADIGVDSGTPVVETLGVGEATRFGGTIERVTLEIR